MGAEEATVPTPATIILRIILRITQRIEQRILPRFAHPLLVAVDLMIVTAMIAIALTWERWKLACIWTATAMEYLHQPAYESLIMAACAAQNRGCNSFAASWSSCSWALASSRHSKPTQMRMA